MTKITTDFTGLENATVRLSRFEAIHTFWRGAGAYALLDTLGDLRADVNGLLPTDIADDETFGSWLTKWNALNEPDKLLNDTLKDANPALFLLADDTARIFGPDGVTAVSAPGTAVSLGADDWQGITTGAQLVTGNATLPTGWSGDVTTGPWTKTAGTANSATWSIGTLVSGRAYVVEIVYDAITASTLTPRFTGGSTVAGLARSAAGSYRQIIVATAAHTTLDLQATASTAAVVSSVSVREITNWPAFQNTAAARPTWGRAPAQVRNLLTNSDLAGAVAGTPGTPPTGWFLGGLTGQIVAVAADGLLGGNSVRISASSGRHILEPAAISVAPSTTYEFSVNVEVYTGAQLFQFVTAINLPAGASISGYKLDGVAAAGTDAVSAGLHTLTVVVTIGATPGTMLPRMGVGCQGNTTADVRFWAPRVTTAANASLPYQRRGATPTDITESGVTSFGLLSFDGSDDALTMQLANGGTVAVALFGRGGSYLIPSITLAAPSVLALGPLSVLDDGVLVAGCPTGIFRAVGTVPWSSRFELVGVAVMKANPTAEEQARALRYFAAFGARGWLVEGPELLVSPPALGTDWSGSGPWTKTAGVASGLSWALSLTPQTPYLLRANITQSAGAVTPSLQGGTVVTYSRVDGTSSVFEVAISAAGNTSLLINANTAFAGGVADASLKALTPPF